MHAHRVLLAPLASLSPMLPLYASSASPTALPSTARMSSLLAFELISADSSCSKAAACSSERVTPDVMYCVAKQLGVMLALCAVCCCSAVEHVCLQVTAHAAKLQNAYGLCPHLQLLACGHALPLQLSSLACIQPARQARQLLLQQPQLPCQQPVHLTDRGRRAAAQLARQLGQRLRQRWQLL